MLRSICYLVLIVFIGCGQSGNVTAPTNTERLGKVVAQQAQHAEVVLTLTQMVTDGSIEFKYPSLFEEGTDILSLARTNSNGQASFLFWPAGESTYTYTARAFDGGTLLGAWDNVPVVVGYKVAVELREDGSLVETNRTPLEPIYYKPIDENATSGASKGSG